MSLPGHEGPIVSGLALCHSTVNRTPASKVPKDAGHHFWQKDR